METPESAFVLGQRRTLAAVALGLALLSFLNLAGLEKAVLAIVLGIKALSAAPPPALEHRRGWARLAVGLASVHVLLLLTVIVLYFDRLSTVVDALRALSDLR